MRQAGKFSRFSLFSLMLAASLLAAGPAAAKQRHLLYVASPGIRNYVEYGGIGVLVFDIDDGYKFVKRIPTWDLAAGQKPENVKGIAASAKTGRLYVTTMNRMIALDTATGKKVWDRAYEGGCDRMAISPDGKFLYVPSFEGPHWNVIDGATGDIITKVVTNAGAHNTIISRDGKRAYLAGLHSPLLSVADTTTNKVVKTVGPFGDSIRPFTVNGAGTLCFINENKLLGFEVGDLRTGKLLHRVEIQGQKQGPVKRHGCPSHGIGLTPDEKELWVADGANNYLHVFDATVMPPKQMTSIKMRDMPGWVTFSMDGAYEYSSTGEIVDTHSKKIVATLQDEAGRQVQSEKIIELMFDGDKLTAAGNQFGVGMKR